MASTFAESLGHTPHRALSCNKIPSHAYQGTISLNLHQRANQRAHRPFEVPGGRQRVWVGQEKAEEEEEAAEAAAGAKASALTVGISSEGSG